MFSVGLVQPAKSGNDVLVVLAGATGAIAVALQIGYLPAIYQAFNRRESLVTLMESRAGVPAWGPEILMRHQLVRITDALPGLYADWELWSADLAESHISYPVLLWFRSPEPGFSWVLSLLAVLDAAALHLSLSPRGRSVGGAYVPAHGLYSPSPHRADAALELRGRPLARIGRCSLPTRSSPRRLQLVRDTGFAVERSSEEAWPHFRGWRVNYEALAYRLADVVVAPRAPWSGARRHLPLELDGPQPSPAPCARREALLRRQSTGLLSSGTGPGATA